MAMQLAYSPTAGVSGDYWKVVLSNWSEIYTGATNVRLKLWKDQASRTAEDGPIPGVEVAIKDFDPAAWNLVDITGVTTLRQAMVKAVYLHLVARAAEEQAKVDAADPEDPGDPMIAMFSTAVSLE